MNLDVFVSVGATANERQETFVTALENRLRSEGIVPHSVGRNTFSSDAPIKTVRALMDRCVGSVVIALERSYFPHGIEKRGGKDEKALEEIKLATPWNQIEAAMSYSRQMPLLVILERGIKEEGLLEPGYDWYVLNVDLQDASLGTPQFNGVLASWKEKLEASTNDDNQYNKHLDVTDLSVGDLVKLMKPAQLWAILVILAGVASSSFTLGARLFSQ